MRGAPADMTFRTVAGTPGVSSTAWSALAGRGAPNFSPDGSAGPGRNHPRRVVAVSEVKGTLARDASRQHHGELAYLRSLINLADSDQDLRRIGGLAFAMRVAGAETARGEAPRRPGALSKVLVALAGEVVMQALLALCLISAQQLLTPRQMPLGVVGPSLVVQGAQSKLGIDPIFYKNKSAALSAANQGELYGAYVACLPT
jgi:hypothetical protein